MAALLITYRFSLVLRIYHWENIKRPTEVVTGGSYRLTEYEIKGGVFMCIVAFASQLEENGCSLY